MHIGVKVEEFTVAFPREGHGSCKVNRNPALVGQGSCTQQILEPCLELGHVSCTL